jgi:hypothetical protein
MKAGNRRSGLPQAQQRGTSAGMTPAAFTLVTDLFLLPLILCSTPTVIHRVRHPCEHLLVSGSTTHASIPQKWQVRAEIFRLRWNCERLLSV